MSNLLFMMMMMNIIKIQMMTMISHFRLAACINNWGQGMGSTISYQWGFLSSSSSSSSWSSSLSPKVYNDKKKKNLKSLLTYLLTIISTIFANNNNESSITTTIFVNPASPFFSDWVGSEASAKLQTEIPVPQGPRWPLALTIQTGPNLNDFKTGPNLWPFKTGPNSSDNDFKPELKADLWQWFQIGIILWPLHVNPCDNYFKALMGQFQTRTISRWRRDQDQRRQVKLTPPWWRFVKMPQEHDRNFIYMTFPGWSKWLSENQSFFGAATKVGLCLNFQGGWFHFYQTQSI